MICCRCETASPSFWLGPRFVQLLTYSSAEQVHTATGFPVPLPRYPWSQRPQTSEVRQRILRQWASRQAQQKLLVAQRAKEQAAHGFQNRERHDKDEDSLLQPVFRASPYIAEVLRAQRPVTQASILFLDEGNHCRCIASDLLCCL